jgi:hypothetical protein
MSEKKKKKKEEEEEEEKKHGKKIKDGKYAKSNQQSVIYLEKSREMP